MGAREFYEFVLEREAIRLRRLAGIPQDEWTQDEILKKFKFTNVKREHDRTTRELYARFYHEYDRASSTRDAKKELLLNCTIARFFGTVEFCTSLGWSKLPTTENGKERLRTIICQQALDNYREKKDVFTGAYIVPNCGDTRPKHVVVADIVVEACGKLGQAVDCSISWEAFCKVLQSIRGFGPFMSKEVILDYILVSGWCPTDWNTYTPVGPGACRGASRVVGDGPMLEGRPLKEKAALKICETLYEQRHDFWAPQFVFHPTCPPAHMVDLCLTDIQFQLCEFDKYNRARLGEGRPKKMFVPTND